MVYNMRAACSKSSDVRELESGCRVGRDCKGMYLPDRLVLYQTIQPKYAIMHSIAMRILKSYRSAVRVLMIL